MFNVNSLEIPKWSNRNYIITAEIRSVIRSSWFVFNCRDFVKLLLLLLLILVKILARLSQFCTIICHVILPKLIHQNWSFTGSRRTSVTQLIIIPKSTFASRSSVMHICSNCLIDISSWAYLNFVVSLFWFYSIQSAALRCISPFEVSHLGFFFGVVSLKDFADIFWHHTFGSSLFVYFGNSLSFYCPSNLQWCQSVSCISPFGVPRGKVSAAVRLGRLKPVSSTSRLRFPITASEASH
jgi:hypothetical protein